MQQLRNLALALCSICACGPAPNPHGGGGGDDDGNGPDAAVTVPDGKDQRCEKIDVLFVIDNSGSMGQEQTNLIANFPQFITVLNNSGLDYRVAVTTTGRNYSYTMQTPLGGFTQTISGGDDGAMLQPAQCNMQRRWIEKADADPSGTFSCVANVGTSGPSDEMPLSAMRHAFEQQINNGTNVGFKRPDALLGIVLLTDEEDCSYEQPVNLPFASSLCESMQEPVANYVAFLDQFTGSRTRWAAAAIAGPGPGSCSSSFGNAEEAKRLKAFVQQTGQNAVMSSICEGDLSIGLAQALAVFESACDGIVL
ncbi:MAG: hypothetical protein KIT31_30355 [Deltaproteobacteria bacterium]|nr:hypothetical protein [Deltaproteobacteria bacterium]